MLVISVFKSGLKSTEQIIENKPTVTIFDTHTHTHTKKKGNRTTIMPMSCSLKCTKVS